MKYANNQHKICICRKKAVTLHSNYKLSQNDQKHERRFYQL